jgi:hypothetical protein
MSNTIAYQGQSFIDKVLENTGSIENVFQMALLNDISITDDLSIGMELKISEATNKRIVELFGEFNRPATALTNQNYELIVPDDGIGAMIIENTFIVR